MRFFRQEYWSGLPFPSPGDLPDPGIKFMSPVLTGRSFTTEPPVKALRQSTKTECKVYTTDKMKGWQRKMLTYIYFKYPSKPTQKAGAQANHSLL